MSSAFTSSLCGRKRMLPGRKWPDLQDKPHRFGGRKHAAQTSENASHRSQGNHRSTTKLALPQIAVATPHRIPTRCTIKHRRPNKTPCLKMFEPPKEKHKVPPAVLTSMLGRELVKVPLPYPRCARHFPRSQSALYLSELLDFTYLATN